MERVVFFVSDRTGITAETLGHTLLTQFPGIGFRREMRRFIDTPAKAQAVAQEIDRAARETGLRPLVFSTLIDAATRQPVAAANGVLFDFVDAFVGPLEKELAQPSAHTVGRTHSMADAPRYNLRIDAVNHALALDDGLNTKDYARADVIVLGVSRCGKTPTCLYLALSFGIYAANFPLTPEDLDDLRLPAALKPHRARLFGLTIAPARLQQIRRERRPEAAYSSLKQCEYEVRQAEALYRQENIPHLDTTAMSVEEIATNILENRKLVSRLA
jgi:regulator of PEP synthase PpsR (kinase-PPPase family)